MIEKSAKYAIRFYAVCTNVNTYCFSLFNNGTGNKTDVVPMKRYAHIYKELRTPADYF